MLHVHNCDTPLCPLHPNIVLIFFQSNTGKLLFSMSAQVSQHLLKSFIFRNVSLILGTKNTQTLFPAITTVPLRLCFFLDICSGEEAPLTEAVRLSGHMVLAPFDAHPNQGGAQHNLCTTEGQDLLFRLVWSGCIALAHAAPPCSNMSMLKLRPGGPPAIRCPDALDGWPGETAAHCEALQDSTTVHLVVIEALDALWSMGGHISWENPRSSMALCHEEVSHFLKRVRADIFPVARSAYDPTFDKE